jgi:hypothetical protein
MGAQGMKLNLDYVRDSLGDDWVETTPIPGTHMFINHGRKFEVTLASAVWESELPVKSAYHAGTFADEPHEIMALLERAVSAS